MTSAPPAAPRRTRVPRVTASAWARRRRKWTDSTFTTLTRSAALLTVALLAVMVWILGRSAAPSISTFGAKFVVSSDWRPNELEVPVRDAEGRVKIEDGQVVTETIPPSFGALAVIWGTAVSSTLALVFAVPVGLATALFLVRVCGRNLAGPFSFVIEFLAAIPSIAYGMWGLMVVAPLLQDHLEPLLRTLFDWPGLHWLFQEQIRVGSESVLRELPLTGRDMFSGGLVLGIMILPIVTAISRDVLRAVPREQVEGTLALGATWWQSSWAMLRYSRSGLLGAALLGLARAVGETMAVTMVIGNANQIRASIFAPAQTMSSLLANEFAEATTELHRAALCEVALVLFVMSLFFNIAARTLVVGGVGKVGARA